MPFSDENNPIRTQVGLESGSDVLQLPPGHAAHAEGEKSLGEEGEGRATPASLLN